MSDAIDVAAEPRWTAWKTEGARLEVLRAGRMRKVFTTALLAPVLWLLWRL